jgi:molybdate transport system substrate-binding protein
VRRVAAACVALLLTTAACGSSEASDDRTTLTVFAAASLKGSFTDVGAAFEKAHPGVTVRFSFAGSSDLVAQLQQGAPADVFASADTSTMDKAAADGVVDGPTDFATNTLEIATPPGNPAGIDSLDDLARPGVKVVVCAAAVPCGAAAARVEKASGVAVRPVSEEQSVTDVLGKVVSGEADAGLVYVTDVRGAGGKVTGVTFSEASEVVNTYPIATIRGSKHAAVARAFRDFVATGPGQATLQTAGFGAPPR